MANDTTAAMKLEKEPEDYVEATELDREDGPEYWRRAKTRLRCMVYFNGQGAAHCFTPHSGLVTAARTADGKIDTTKPVEVTIFDTDLPKLLECVETLDAEIAVARRTWLRTVADGLKEAGFVKSTEQVPENVDEWPAAWRDFERSAPEINKLSTEAEFYRANKRGILPLAKVAVVAKDIPLPETDAEKAVAKAHARTMAEVGKLGAGPALDDEKLAKLASMAAGATVAALLKAGVIEKPKASKE